MLLPHRTGAYPVKRMRVEGHLSREKKNPDSTILSLHGESTLSQSGLYLHDNWDINIPRAILVHASIAP